MDFAVQMPLLSLPYSSVSPELLESHGWVKADIWGMSQCKENALLFFPDGTYQESFEAHEFPELQVLIL